jgi:hypothetical protein
MLRGFAAATLAFAAASCGESAPRAPLAPPAEAPSGAPSLEGAIDAKKALALLYGPYDERLQAAHWSQAAKGKGKPQAAGANAMLVKALLAQEEKDGDLEHFYLATAVFPESPDEPFDCEACAPSIGFSIFTHRGDRWALEAHAPEIFEAGMNGNAPGAKLVTTGPARHDLLIEWSFGNRGVMESYAVLVGAASKAPAQLFALTTASENSGDCGADTSMAAPCYGYEIKLDFRPNGQNTRYEIHASGKGSTVDYSEEERKANAFSGTAVYRFEGDKYVAVSKPKHWPEGN